MALACVALPAKRRLAPMSPSAALPQATTPELFRMISEARWSEGISRCQSHPSEASFREDSTGLTALHAACKSVQTPVEVIVALLSAFPAAAMSRTKNYSSTPLHFACWRNLSVEIIVLLLSVNPGTARVPNGLGLTPLHLAARTGNKDVVAALMSIAPETSCLTSKSGYTPLHLSLRSSGDNGRHPAQDGDAKSRFSTLDFVSIVRTIVGRCPQSLDVSNRFDETPLFIFCARTEARVRALMQESKTKDDELRFLRDHEELKLIWSTFLMLLMGTSESNYSPGQVLCSFARNQDSVNSITFTLLAVKLCPGGLSEKDGSGNLPLHVLCSNSFTPRQFKLNGSKTTVSINALDIFLAYNKESSKVHNSAGELPLKLLLKSEGASWDEGISSLLSANPAASTDHEEATRLVPFMLAATNEGRDASLNSTFDLLRLCPEFSRFGSIGEPLSHKRSRSPSSSCAKRVRI